MPDPIEPPVRLAVDGPWADGPCETLAHALELAEVDSDRNRRLAYLMVDNAVELALKTFLGLPTETRGGSRSGRPKDPDPRFHQLVASLHVLVPEGLPGVDRTELRFLHSLRNTLYHQGNGLAPDRKKLEAYLVLARVLLSALFSSPAIERAITAVGVEPLAISRPPMSGTPEDAQQLADLLDRMRERHRRLGPGTPGAVLLPGDSWEAIAAAMEELRQHLVELASDPREGAGFNWAVERLEQLDDFAERTSDEDISADAILADVEWLLDLLLAVSA